MGGPASTETTCLTLQKKRERSDSSIQYAQDLRLEQATEPPPTFPFLESQCQRALFWREFSSCQENYAARKVIAYGRRGRGI
jgi:hypothetical protein